MERSEKERKVVENRYKVNNMKLNFLYFDSALCMNIEIKLKED